MKVRIVALLFLSFFILSAEAKILDSLVIEGLNINSSGVIKNNIELREGREFSSSDIQESIRRLYTLGLFKTVDFDILAETDSSASLKLSIIENPICETIEYSGNKKLKVKDIEEKVTLKKGQVLSDAAVFKNVQILKSLYADKGYNLVEIKTEQISTKIPGKVIVKFSIKENARVRISNITFNGNTQIKTSKLLMKFKTKEARWWRGGEFKKEEYKAHLDTLLMYYNDLGYLDASVVKDTVWYSDNKKDINIDITLSEGRKYIAGHFFFTGNKIIDTDSLKSKITLKLGKPFQKSRFDMSKYLVENAYREEGYLWVMVDDKRSYRGDTIDVTFDVSEGRPAIVRKVDIKGNNKTMEKVIRREIDLLPGKKYKQSLMMRSRQNILALNYFSDVRPDLVPNEDGTIDMVFDIAEKDNIGQLQIGAAYQMTDGFVGTFSTAIPNFRGAGQELRINLEYGKNRRNVTLGFTEPWAFDMPLSLTGTVFYDWTKTNVRSGDEETSYGFTIGAGRTRLKWPDNHFRINGTYQLSYEKSSADTIISEENRLKVLQSGYLSRLTLGIERYDLDMPMFPTSGSRLTVTPQIAGLGGDFKYFKGTLGYEHYLPLPFKFVASTRTKLGLIRGIGKNDITISRSDLFQTGGVYGDADNRGYEEYYFGGWSNNPATGLHMLSSTLELRYPVLDQQLYIGGFFDYGNTWEKTSDINLKDMYKSIGVGIRLSVPMLGVMGIDFGWGLDHPSNDPFKGEKNKFNFNFLMNRGF